MLPFKPLSDLINNRPSRDDSERHFKDEVLPAAQREGAVFRLRGKLETGAVWGYGVCIHFSKDVCDAGFSIEFQETFWGPAAGGRGWCDEVWVQLEGIPYLGKVGEGLGTVDSTVLLVTWVHEVGAPAQ